MFTVALIGPDGAGKTTVIRRLVEELPFPAKSIYMGVNMHESNVMLPTTRLVLAVRRARGSFSDSVDRSDIKDDVSPRASDAGLPSRVAESVRGAVRLLNWLGEESFRQGVAWFYKRRGTVVIFDRHFLSDYYASDVEGKEQDRALSRRIHSFFLTRLYPKPDLMIHLDAPSDVLYARKPEGTLKRLEQRRREYLSLREVFPHLQTVDASGPADDVLAAVTRVILDFYLENDEIRRKTDYR